MKKDRVIYLENHIASCDAPAVLRRLQRRSQRWRFALLLLCAGLCATPGLSANVDSARYNEYEIKAAFIYNFLKFVEWPQDQMTRNSGQIVVGIIGEDPFGQAFDVFKDKKVDERNVVVRRFESLTQLVDAVEKDKKLLEKKFTALRTPHFLSRDTGGNFTLRPLDEFEEVNSAPDAATRAKRIDELKKRGLILVDPSKIENFKALAATIAAERMDTLRKCHLLFISRSEKKDVGKILYLVQNQGVVTVADWPGFLQAGGLINFVVDENKIRFEINLTGAERARVQIRSQLLRLARKVFKNGAEVTGSAQEAG